LHRHWVDAYRATVAFFGKQFESTHRQPSTTQ
jgi:hypothetical protein